MVGMFDVIDPWRESVAVRVENLQHISPVTRQMGAMIIRRSGNIGEAIEAVTKEERSCVHRFEYLAAEEFLKLRRWLEHEEGKEDPAVQELKRSPAQNELKRLLR